MHPPRRQGQGWRQGRDGRVLEGQDLHRRGMRRLRQEPRGAGWARQAQQVEVLGRLRRPHRPGGDARPRHGELPLRARRAAWADERRLQVGRPQGAGRHPQPALPASTTCTSC
jgi:hypothetical protein